MKGKKKSTTKKWIKGIAIFFGSLFLIFIAIILFIRSEWGQDIIVNKTVNYLKDTTGTTIEIEKLYVTFGGNVLLEGLYVEDQQNDTLVYSKSLEASIEILPIVRGDKFHLKYFDWSGVKANIKRKDGSEDYNFQFLIDAFVTPDTTTVTQPTEKSMEIEIGEINIADVEVRFDDQEMGVNTSIKIGVFETEVENFDLTAMKFKIDELLLKDTEFTYLQTKPFAEAEPTEESLLPEIVIGELKLENILGMYDAQVDQTYSDIRITDFLLKESNINLQKQVIISDGISLTDSQILFKSLSKIPEQEKKDTDTTVTTPVDFEWPAWNVQLEEAEITNTDIALQFSEKPSVEGTFDSENIKIIALDVELADILLEQNKASLDLKNLSFLERSGMQLRRLAANIQLTDKKISTAGLHVDFTKSSLSGKFTASFSSIDALINTPEKTTFNLSIPNISLYASDAYYFQPDLKENPYVQAVAKNDITAQVFIQGTLENMQVKNSYVAWGEATRLSIRGAVKNVLDTDSLYVDFNKIEARTQRSDFVQFIDKNQLSVAIPDTIVLKAKVAGTLDNIKANALLRSSDGSIKLDGSFQNKTSIAFDGKLEVDQLALDKILKNEQLGAISLTASVSGKGNSINTLDALLTSDIQELTFNGYDFSTLHLDGEIKNGEGDVHANFKDENLNLKLKTAMVLDSVSPKFDVNLQIIGADLNKLGLTQKIIKTQFDLRVLLEGNTEAFVVDATLDNATVVYNNEAYSIAPVIIKASSDSTKTALNIHSSFLKGELTANANITPVIAGVQNQLKQYVFKESSTGTLKNPLLLNAEFSFQEVPVLSEVFMPGLKDSDTLKVSMAFDETKQLLSAKVAAPLLKYQEGTIDSLLLSFKADKEGLDFKLHWNAIDYDPIMIQETNISGELKNDMLFVNFNTFDDTGSIAELQTEFTIKKDSLFISVNPESLLLDRTPWKIEENNKVIVSKEYLYFENFVLSKNEQQLKITSNHPDVKKENLKIDFANFSLANFTSFLNSKEVLAGGMINGYVTIEEPVGDMGILADLNIKDLVVTEVPLGDLTLNASSKELKRYDLALGLDGKNINLKMQGEYAASGESANLDLKVDLKRLEMQLIEDFTEDLISNTSGSLSGTASIQGDVSKPKYSGDFTFNQTSFLVAMLNTTFILPEEQITISNEGLFFNQFTITDPDKNRFVMDGAIKTESFTNPSFDLTLKAKDFRLINATKEDNDLFYGQVHVTSDLFIKGDLAVPKIRGDIKVDENSNFTLVIPESELDIREREGVVLFVNRENPDAILTRVDEDKSQIAAIKGFDMDIKLIIGQKSLLKIVIDERSGDNIQVRGTGDFLFGMDPNGRMSLSGRYDISDGEYKVSLYNLVKREFDIAPESFISWNGDPLDATLAVKAIYKVETNASPIMIGGNANQYNRDLDFLVYLNVDGELLEPEISFAMDMPEDQQALSGGAVYGRIQQLNNEESELNKQVFSLLVFNKFFNISGNDGSTGGPASIARDNVNKVLSGQLNNFSDKLVGKTGVELDFQLDSYDSYGSKGATTTTDLEINAQKKLFNDRVIVQVGSSVNVEGTNQADEGASPVIGNVSLQYLVTEDGKYRLKAFRKNEFESVIDGQLIVTGIGFIFNREFNKFRELWSKTAKELEAEEKKEKEKELDQKLTEQKKNTKNTTNTKD